jgi:iron complex outermembrane receptor protein
MNTTRQIDNKGTSKSARSLRIPAMICASSVLAGSLSLAGEPASEETLGTVYVTGERVGNELDAERSVTPGAVSVIDTETLHERAVTQLADLLRYVPGVWAESYNGNDDVFYSSRGSNLDAIDYDKNGVKFLQDGLPVTAADGNNHNRAIDPMNSRYAIVAHGANALAHGASTLGGAVDFISPTAHTTPNSVSLSGGSFGQWGARATVGGVSGALDGLLSVETQQRDGYRRHSMQDRRNVYANLGWQATKNVSTRFHATWSDYDTDLPRELSLQQVAEDRWQARPDAIDGDHSKAVEAWRLAFKTTLAEVAGGTLELGASYEEQALYHPIVSGPFFSLLIDTDHKDTGAMLRFRRNAGSHALVFGANYGFSTMTGGNYSNEGGEPGFLMWTSDDDASTLELFALDRWNFAPNWTLVYGAQYVTAKREVGGVHGDYDGFNPRLGVIRRLDEGAEWYASASRIYEAPTTMQMTDFGSPTGVPLDAMHGLVVETGLRGTAQRGATRLHWDVSGYYTALRDEILSTTDPILPDGDATNFDKTTHAGIEAVVGMSFAFGDGGHRIEPLLAATFNAFSFDADPEYGHNRLPAAPRYFARGEVMYRNATGFSAGPTFDFVGRRFADYENTWSLGSFGLLGARAAFATGNWELYAEGRNLLDKEHFAAINVSTVANLSQPMLHPGAPRSVYFGARYRF